ncbi:MAG: RNA 2'-phosphotransferase [Oscillospiraceae bacterium]|nr:RNA 2'-phosphotransferase [Oscillospiraceae bacterium]
MDLIKTGRYISYLLRHHPEDAGLTLDEHGWVDVNELISAVGRTYKGFTRTVLDEIVATNNKKRFSYSEDGMRIRANQGHTIAVDVELSEAQPPEILWHGTGEKYVESINRTGLIPKSRLHVHLSKDTETAMQVGSRHGKPVVYKVLAGKMAQDGYKFYLSVNGVWLTDKVPVEYLVQNVEET